jgi:uncharacterized membrane protein
MVMISGLDAIALAVSVGCVAGYHGYLRRRLREDPHFTVHVVNELARTRWVMAVMANGGRDVLAVQTLRNSVMASSFMASTAILLMIGVLTLGSSAGSGGLWHALDIGVTEPRLVTLKLILLLADFFLAFFCFSMAVRFFNHVGYMINVPVTHAVAALAPARVANYINRAGRCYTLGTRAFFFCVPLVFWFFGPHFMLAATVVLLAGLYFLDRAPVTNES